jgi:hypothetical protein
MNNNKKQQINNNAVINRGSLYLEIANCAFHSKDFLPFKGRIQLENYIPG